MTASVETSRSTNQRCASRRCCHHLLMGCYNFCTFLMCWMLLTSSSVVSSSSFYQPPEIVSKNGTLEVVLTVQMVETLNGTRMAPAYNGGPVGPTLRCSPGDTITVKLVNQLKPSSKLDRELMSYVMDPQNEMDHPANVSIIYNRLSSIGNYGNPQYGFWGFQYQNVHFHGVGIPSSIELLLKPTDGKNSRTFTYTIPANHPGGLYWYHNHVHGVSTYAFLSGLFGIIIIEGHPTDIRTVPDIGNATEIVMIMSESLVDENKKPVPVFPFLMEFGWKSVVNGKLAETMQYTCKAGETLLVRAVSASVEPTITLSWMDGTGPKFYLLTEDGYRVSSITKNEKLAIAPGGRAEFMIKFTSPGTYYLQREGWDAGGLHGIEACTAAFGIPVEVCVSYDIVQPIATFIVTAGTENMKLPRRLPPVAPVLQRKAKKAITDKGLVLMQFTDSYPIFQIPYNGPFVPPGVAFGMNNRLVTPTFRHGVVKAGTCEQWIVASLPSPGHAFHSHPVPFLVTHINEVPIKKPFWRDTYTIPSNNVTIKICFDGTLTAADFFLLHCHQVTHMDIGMAMYLDVAPQKN